MKIVAMIIIVSLSILMVFHIPAINADFTLVLEHKEHFQIRWDTLESLVGLVGSEVGYNLIAGETLFVSWKITEQPLILPPCVWLFTKEQTYHFNHIIGGPVPFYNYILKTIAWEGNFTYTVPQNGTYCVILDNPAWGALDLTGPILDAQVYEAVLTVPTPALAPHGPKAEFTAIPETANVGELVKFDATTSQPGWNGTNLMSITEYRWDLGDGNKTTTTTPIIYHVFSSSGIYYPTLTVFASGATPETDSITHRVVIITVPVGGYSISVRERNTAIPSALYLSIMIMLTVIFTTARCKKRRKNIESPIHPD